MNVTITVKQQPEYGAKFKVTPTQYPCYVLIATGSPDHKPYASVAPALVYNRRRVCPVYNCYRVLFNEDRTAVNGLERGNLSRGGTSTSGYTYTFSATSIIPADNLEIEQRK
ncbi:MAG: hypothetical protein RR382_00215 [Tannerellaceae bacterium]